MTQPRAGLRGCILLNGRRMLPQQTVQTGDEILAGPASRLVFLIGNAALHARQHSRLTVERGSPLNMVSLLCLFNDPAVSAFGRSRTIITPTLTTGIRGTGAHTKL